MDHTHSEGTDLFWLFVDLKPLSKTCLSACQSACLSVCTKPNLLLVRLTNKLNSTTTVHKDNGSTETMLSCRQQRSPRCSWNHYWCRCCCQLLLQTLLHVYVCCCLFFFYLNYQNMYTYDRLTFINTGNGSAGIGLSAADLEMITAHNIFQPPARPAGPSATESCVIPQEKRKESRDKS